MTEEAKTEETQSFRNKPRNRKSPYAAIRQEMALKRKPPTVLQSEEKGKIISVRVNAEEYKDLLKAMDVYGYEQAATFLKECWKGRQQIESYRLERAREISVEMRKLGITARMLDGI